MNSSRKLLALVMIAALLAVAFAPTAYAQFTAILVPLCLLCACMGAVQARRMFERCSLPAAPFSPLLAARAPPSR